MFGRRANAKLKLVKMSETRLSYVTAAQKRALEEARNTSRTEKRGFQEDRGHRELSKKHRDGTSSSNLIAD